MLINIYSKPKTYLFNYNTFINTHIYAKQLCLLSTGVDRASQILDQIFIFLNFSILHAVSASHANMQKSFLYH